MKKMYLALISRYNSSRDCVCQWCYAFETQKQRKNFLKKYFLSDIDLNYSFYLTTSNIVKVNSDFVVIKYRQGKTIMQYQNNVVVTNVKNGDGVAYENE